MRTIVITGAASGMCAAAADRLKREGQRVIGVDVKPTDVVADLASAEGRREAVARVTELSGGAIDGLVSGAGLGPYAEPEPVLRVNYFGALQMLTDLQPLLARGQEPAAVAISSLGAVFDVVVDDAVLARCLDGDEDGAIAAAARIDGNTAYSTAKRGLALQVRSLVQTFGDAGVRLNALAPGAIETPMLDAIFAHPEIGDAVRGLPIPLGRTAPPEEMASVIAFLLGADARYVHGAVIHADGGADALVRPTAL